MDPNIIFLYRIIGAFCCFSENLPTRAFNYKSKLKSPKNTSNRLYSFINLPDFPLYKT